LMWRGLEPRERRALIESFQQFRAEPHTILYLTSINQYCIYPVIKFTITNAEHQLMHQGYLSWYNGLLAFILQLGYFCHNKWVELNCCFIMTVS
jgi:hypothetical protein